MGDEPMNEAGDQGQVAATPADPVEKKDRREEDGEQAIAPAIGGEGTPTERLLATKELLEELLRHMESATSVEVRDTPEAIACRLDAPEDDPLFHGPDRSQVVEALQFFANRIINRDHDDRKRIVLAVGEEVGEGDQAMALMAEGLAETVRRMKVPLTVVGMEARHRRILHLALADEEDVRTHSKGFGGLRRIVVEAGPKE